jgi:Carboxypeptidase regulatory-like domain
MNSILSSLFICLPFLLQSNSASEVTIQGRVVLAFTQQKEGVEQASVTLRTKMDNKVVSKTKTTSDGEYQFPKVSKGNYVVMVEVLGHKPKPATKSIDVNDQNPTKADAIELINENAELAYFAYAASTMKLNAENSPDKNKCYLSQWNQITFNYNLNASSRAKFAKSLIEIDSKSADSVVELKYFAQSNPNDIAALESLIKHSLVKNEGPPNPNVLKGLNVDSNLVPYVVLGQFHDLHLPKEQQNAYADKFKLEWEGQGESSKTLYKLMKQGEDFKKDRTQFDFPDFNKSKIKR